MADFSTLLNTNNYRNQSVTTPKLADANVTNGKMATDSVNTSQLVAGSVTTAKVASTAITAAKLNADTAGAGLSLDATTGLAVNVERGLQLPADSIGIADSGVITAYIADSNVTTAKLADSGVTTAKINDAAVTTAKIADANVTTAKLADLNVTTAKINDNAVVAGKLADVVDETRAMAQDATSNEIYLNIRSSLGGMLAFDAAAAGALYIPTDSITADQLADGSVDTAAIQTSAVTPAKANLTATWDFSSGTLQSASPTQPSQVANKEYVDAIAQGLDVKGSCRAGTIADITLSGLQTLDGVTLVGGDRVLVKNQTAAADNGIYIAASGAWARSADMDLASEFAGAFTFIEEGTGQADTGWVCTTNNPVVIGTTEITWVQFSSAGVVLAGAGLTKSGNTLNVNVASGVKIDGSNNVALKLVSSNPGLFVDASGLKATADANRALSIAAGGVGLDIKPNSGLAIASSQLGVVLDTNKLVFNGAAITMAAGGASTGVAFGNLQDSLLSYVGKPAGAFASPSIANDGTVSAVSGVFAAGMPNTLVFLNGLLMSAGADYSTTLVAGSLTIAFNDAVTSADKCVVLYKPATL